MQNTADTQRDLRARLAGHRHRPLHRRARARPDPTDSLEQQHPWRRNLRLDDRVAIQILGRAEIGIHRPLPVFGDEDQAARGRRFQIRGAGVVNATPMRADIVGEDLAQLILRTPAR